MPDNDDSGAMGSFLTFNQIGFFPVAAQNFYVIGSPTFPRSSIFLANGKTFSVVAESSSPTNIFTSQKRCGMANRISAHGLHIIN
ncbi:glycoside hydrolase domain-containing protein [Edaphobacter bradus]|uniref:glycoside hydrolase domain-containing protein n=1 Tax=Edaphobacter bradus TaxID=2259016 RepID=UPI0037C08F5A